MEVALDQYQYPINLVGIDEHRHDEDPALKRAYSGDVITREGEIIGQWKVSETWLEGMGTGYGKLEFWPEGHDAALFNEEIGVISSGVHYGMAMSDICRDIREWYENANGPIG